MSIFSKLKLDEWYKVLVYIGGFGFLFSIFFPVQVFDNKNMMLLFAGLLFTGLGEWKNHKWFSGIKNRSVLTGPPALLKTKMRKPDNIGRILILIGVLLIILSILQITKIYQLI